MSAKKYYRRWFWQGTIGILLFGTGLCLLLESSWFKYSDPPVWQWVAAGTGSLIVVMAGAILMIDSLRYRIKYEDSLPEK